MFHLEEAFEAFVADRETGVSSSRGSPTVAAGVMFRKKAECGPTAGAIAEAPGRGYPPIGECWCMLTTATTARKGV